MEQTRVVSMIEACINTFIGFIISYAAFPFFAGFLEMPFNHSQHFFIILFFTVLSVIRSYVIRRWFNTRFYHKYVERLARFRGL